MALLRAVTTSVFSPSSTLITFSPRGISDAEPKRDAIDAPAMNTVTGRIRTAAEMSQSQFWTPVTPLRGSVFNAVPHTLSESDTAQSGLCRHGTEILAKPIGRDRRLGMQAVPLNKRKAPIFTEARRRPSIPDPLVHVSRPYVRSRQGEAGRLPSGAALAGCAPSRLVAAVSTLWGAHR